MARYANLKPDTCVGCPALETGKGYVPGIGPSTARVAFLGQGPGEVEVHTGVPFSGPSGQVFTDILTHARVFRKDVWIDNVVRCWLPDNREPTSKERAFCTAAHGFPALAALPNLKVVVPVGIPATKVFLGPKATEAALGTITTWRLPANERPRPD